MLWFLSQTLRFFTVVYREALQPAIRRLFFRGVAEDAFSLASPEQVESIFQQLALPGVWAPIKEKRAEIGNHA
jgi:hypothetical protein